MDARDFITLGLSAERLLTVRHDLTVQHVAPHMPAVYGTPFMILEMELTSGDAIEMALPEGWVTVGTMVNIRHLAATPVGRVVRTTAKVIEVKAKFVTFEVEAFDGDRKIGDGTHGRGLINTADFKTRFGAG